MRFNTSGYNNVAIGNSALYYNNDGSHNTAIGTYSLQSNTTGYSNTAVGEASLEYNTTGYSNTSLGNSALTDNTTGSSNTALGSYALLFNTIGSSNTAIGDAALFANGAGNYNIGLGQLAGSSLLSGNNNIFIGYNAQPNISTSASNQLNIGNWIYGNNGNIGIGVSNPLAKLHINGIYRIDSVNPLIGTLSFGDSYDIVYDGGSDSTFFFKNNGSIVDPLAGTVFKNASLQDILYIANSGNVGIGIAPTATLDVNGQVKIRGGTPGVGKVLVSDATGLASWQNIAATSVTASGVLAGSGDENYIPKFGTGGTGLWSSSIFEKDGNIGIGTSTGTAKLTVAGDSLINGIIV